MLYPPYYEVPGTPHVSEEPPSKINRSKGDGPAIRPRTRQENRIGKDAGLTLILLSSEPFQPLCRRAKSNMTQVNKNPRSDIKQSDEKNDTEKKRVYTPIRGRLMVYRMYRRRWLKYMRRERTEVLGKRVRKSPSA